MRFQRHLRRVLRPSLMAWVALAVAVPVSPAAAAADPSSRYGQCMALAETDPRQALETAMAWTEKGGGDSAGHCAASALMRLDRYTEAANAFELLAQNSSAHPRARAALLGHAGQAWLLDRNPEKAADVLNRAIILVPDDPSLLVDRAQAAFDQRRYRDAVIDLDAALAIDPELVDAYVFRASAHRRLGDLDKAEADANKALSLDGGHPEGRLERGMIYRLKNDKIAARRDWLTLITIAPDTEAARIAKVNLDRMDAAIKFD